jgi:hypothetical protein
MQLEHQLVWKELEYFIMKTTLRIRCASFSILPLTLGAGLAAAGCSTTAVDGTPDAGSAKSGSGSSGSSGGGSSSGASSSGASSSGASSSGASSSGASGSADAGGCFGTVVSCTPVTAPTITDFENWMPTAADGGANDPTQFTYYVNGPPPASGMLGGIQYINDGDGTPALTMIPGYNSNYAVHIGTTTPVGTMDASADWGGFLMFDFLPPTGTPACISPAGYSGIRFWLRGNSGGGSVGIGLGTVESVSIASGGKCDPSADSAACADPTAKLTPIPATWTQITLPWSQFTGGMVTSGCTSPPGSGIIRIVFQPYDLYPGPAYKVAPTSYSLDVDDVQFY